MRAEGEQPTSSAPRRRVVLLGASNLVRNLSTVVNTCQTFWNTPLDILAATGHGRGYGLESWVLGRTLPPIVQCGLWKALEQRDALPTAALLTDIGNDLAYGATACQIAGWVEACLERLRPFVDSLVITHLPVESLASLGPLRFRLMRAVLFPRSQLTMSYSIEHAERLNDHIVRLASRYEAHRVEPQRVWYGFDPIHIKRSHQLRAWRTILAAWNHRGESRPSSRSLRHRWSLCCLRPEYRRLFGVPQYQRQPAAKLPDGSLVSLY